MEHPPICDALWLRRWCSHIASPAAAPLVPPQACKITTPLEVLAWRMLLISRPHRDLVHFFLMGITHGFRIGCGMALKSAKKNLQSAYEHPEVIDEYLRKEVDEARLVGPFSSSGVPEAHNSRFGVYSEVAPSKQVATDCGFITPT